MCMENNLGPICRLQYLFKKNKIIIWQILGGAGPSWPNFFITTRKRSSGKVMFSGVFCLSTGDGGSLGLCPGGGLCRRGCSLSRVVSFQGGFCPGGLCPGSLCLGVSVQVGSVSRGSLSRSVCVQGGSLSGGSLSGRVPVQGVSVWESLCPGGVCLRGVSVREPPLRTVTSGQYESYWNAFLVSCSFC